MRKIENGNKFPDLYQNFCTLLQTRPDPNGLDPIRWRPWNLVPLLSLTPPRGRKKPKPFKNPFPPSNSSAFLYLLPKFKISSTPFSSSSLYFRFRCARDWHHVRWRWVLFPNCVCLSRNPRKDGNFRTWETLTCWVSFDFFFPLRWSLGHCHRLRLSHLQSWVRRRGRPQSGVSIGKFVQICCIELCLLSKKLKKKKKKNRICVNCCKFATNSLD